MKNCIKSWVIRTHTEFGFLCWPLFVTCPCQGLIDYRHVLGSIVLTGEWNCTWRISFVDTYIFSRNYSSLWWYSNIAVCWIRSRPLISDNEPSFYMTCNKAVIIFQPTGIWAGRPFEKKERPRSTPWWWVLIDVDCSHLYCSWKNILRRGFRTILNKNFHFKFKCWTLSSMWYVCIYRKSKSAFKIRPRSASTGDQLNQHCYFRTSDNNGFEFRFDCFHPIFQHWMY